MGPEDAVIRRIGLCSGGGRDEWASAAETGCDAFLSGEIKHHLALALADRGIVAFECGHFATEEPGMEVLAVALQKALPALECNVRVYVSEVPAYAFPR
jgi:putative NIF3 family GTP cyclohydrolase 1 type 2